MGALSASCMALAASPEHDQPGSALAQTKHELALQQPNAGTEVDSRIAVVLPEDDHARIVEDMRAFLAHTADLLDAAAGQDWEKVETLAAGAQPPLHLIQRIANGVIPDPVPLDGSGHTPKTDVSERNRTRPARMQKNLPQSYRDMLLERRLIIEEIARDARAIKDPFHTVRQIAQIQRVCVACHLTYRHKAIPVIHEGAPQAISRQQ